MVRENGSKAKGKSKKLRVASGEKGTVISKQSERSVEMKRLLASRYEEQVILGLQFDSFTIHHLSFTTELHQEVTEFHREESFSSFSFNLSVLQFSNSCDQRRGKVAVVDYRFTI